MKHSETRIPPDKNYPDKVKKRLKITRPDIPEGEPYKFLDFEITEEPAFRKKSKKQSKSKRKSKTKGCGCK